MSIIKERVKKLILAQADLTRGRLELMRIQPESVLIAS